MKKRIVQAFILLIALILIISGCNEGINVLQPASSAVSPTEITTQMPTKSLTPTQSPALTPSPSPNPSPTPTKIGQVITDWPSVKGLTLKDGIYFFEKGNPYGGEEGKEAGGVRENVYVKGEQTGGIYFTPEVCRILLDEALAKIPQENNKVKVIVPLDILDYSGEIILDNYIIKNPKGKLSPGEVPSYIEISCGEVPVVSTTDAQFLDSGYGFMDDMAIRVLCNGYSCQNFSPDLAYNNVFLISTGTDFPEKEGCSDVFFGKKLLIKEAESTIYIDLALEGDEIYMTVDDLLTEGGKPVFIIAKE